MARTRLKVCCIQSVEEARMAIAAGADAIGLVSEMPSGPGVISEELIAEIAAGVPAPVASFLLTSRTDVEGIVAQWGRCRTSVIQIVSRLVAPAQVIGGVRAAIPWVKLVPVVHVEDDRAIGEALGLAAAGADGLLLDSGRPGAKTPELGGTGRTHDWAVSRRLVEAVGPVPVFLAGGLRAENVREAIHAVRPFGVDVCSGVREDAGLSEAKLRGLVCSISGQASRANGEKP
ncbi:MAG: phosphoribosylanthranilate isomerase [bacterium]|nr:phosphoribosylanthranilate isomerase [bacterium]